MLDYICHRWNLWSNLAFNIRHLAPPAPARWLLTAVHVSLAPLVELDPVDKVSGAATSSRPFLSVRNINAWACISGNTVSSGVPFG